MELKRKRGNRRGILNHRKKNKEQQEHRTEENSDWTKE